PRPRLLSCFPRKDLVASPGGALIRSQVVYSILHLVRSVVIGALSLKKRGSVSRISVMSSLQWSPPSVDLLTRSAVTKFSGNRLTDRLIWYASPFGANVTHGSDARS